MEIKKELKNRGISYRNIGSVLGLAHTVVSDIINDKYKGSDETKERVLNHVHLLLQDKQDLNLIIYPEIALYIKVVSKCIKDKSFNDEETSKLIEMSQTLKTFKKNQQQKEN